MMCFPEIQIPPMDICVYIQWEGSSLDLAYTRQENMNKGYIVFKLIYQQTLPHNHISVILSQRHIRSSHWIFISAVTFHPPPAFHQD